MKREMAGIEKKVSNILDRIMEMESRTVISRYESEVEKLEIEKMVLSEKRSHAAHSHATIRKLFEPLLASLQTLELFGLTARSMTSASW